MPVILVPSMGVRIYHCVLLEKFSSFSSAQTGGKLFLAAAVWPKLCSFARFGPTLRRAGLQAYVDNWPLRHLPFQSTHPFFMPFAFTFRSAHFHAGHCRLAIMLDDRPQKYGQEKLLWWNHMGN